MSAIMRTKVHSFRRISNPYEAVGKKSFIAVIQIKHIPEEWEEWKEINPRESSISTGMSRVILDSLLEKPAEFFFKNRGITLLVHKVEFNNTRNEMTLEFNAKNQHGVLDGGHTYQVIRHVMDSISEDDVSNFDDAYVKVEILEGFTDKEEAVEIVQSRNKSQVVKDQSIENLLGNFDSIKGVLGDKSYFNRIAFKEVEFLDENSKKDIDIKEILSYLICFDCDNFSDNVHPVKAYSSKGSVLKHIKKHRDNMEKYLPLLPDILELRDWIYYEFPNTYNSTGGRFGALNGVSELSSVGRKERRVQLSFIDKESKYNIPSSFIYPILASFRNLIDYSGEEYKWKYEPIDFFQSVKEDLIIRLTDQAKSINNPNKLGKSKDVWRSCYDKVENEVLKRSNK